MVRIAIKIGDVFSARINEYEQKFFQVIAFDSTQLNSSVIRSFRKKYELNYQPDIIEILNSEVDFYAHCSAKLGVKLNFWRKIGNAIQLGKSDETLFKCTADYGRKLGAEILKTSDKWYVWKINERIIDIGRLTQAYRKTEIGVVVNPASIVYRMRTGKYDFVYPEN